MIEMENYSTAICSHVFRLPKVQIIGVWAFVSHGLKSVCLHEQKSFDGLNFPRFWVNSEVVYISSSGFKQFIVRRNRIH